MLNAKLTRNACMNTMFYYIRILIYFIYIKPPSMELSRLDIQKILHITNIFIRLRYNCLHSLNGDD